MDQEITLSELPDATSCLERMSSCIFSIQRSLSTQEELLSRQLGHSPQLQVCPSQTPPNCLRSKRFIMGKVYSMSYRLESSCLKVQFLYWRPKELSIVNQPDLLKLSPAYRYIVIIFPTSVKQKQPVVVTYHLSIMLLLTNLSTCSVLSG